MKSVPASKIADTFKGVKRKPRTSGNDENPSQKFRKLHGSQDKPSFKKRKPFKKNKLQFNTKKAQQAAAGHKIKRSKKENSHNKEENETSESDGEIMNEKFLSEPNEASQSDSQLKNFVTNPNKQKIKKKSAKARKNTKEDAVTESLNWKDPHVRAEVDGRTLFVGNVEATIKKKHLIRLFSEFGKVESVRLRCVTPARPGVSKRMAIIKKLMHPKRTTLHCYVTFEKREDALKALKVNGTAYKGHHLRVQICNDTEKPDPRKAIFVGNLPFDAEDDDLWVALESCGQIKSVRVIRNSDTGMGIGVGYVNFESADAVELALQMEDVQVKNKEVRIKRYQEKRKPKERVHQQSKGSSDVNKSSTERGKESKQQEENDKPLVVTVKKTAFQGSKSTLKKKKRKINKGFLQKMKMSNKIAPRLVK